MSVTEYSPAEVVRIGQEIYDRVIKSQVESGNRGKMLVLDVNSGDYEIAVEDIVAYDALKFRRPDAVTYLVRIGAATAFRISGGVQL